MRLNVNGLIRGSRILQLAVAGAMFAAAPAFANLVFNPTFTANFTADFGTNAVAAQNAWIAAANFFSANFTDNIHINITVDATATTSPFGQSNTGLVSTSYTNLRANVAADAKTADDATALGAGGSVTVADPTGGAGTWWVSRAEAKAIGLIADDGANDGTTTFGAGNSFSFSGVPAAGFFDFQGVAAHEISEVMGRIGLKAANSHTLMDLFSYTGASARDLVGGPNNNFSIDNGSTLLKLWNDPSSNGLDSRDWAGGTNDSFNQFSGSGVVNQVSAVDLRLLDVIGYDLASTTPEPSQFLPVAAALGFLLVGLRKRRA